MLNQLIQWVNLFMIDRKIDLTFDGKKSNSSDTHWNFAVIICFIDFIFDIYSNFIFRNKKRGKICKDKNVEFY